jgi:hypothetical protein
MDVQVRYALGKRFFFKSHYVVVFLFPLRAFNVPTVTTAARPIGQMPLGVADPVAGLASKLSRSSWGRSPRAMVAQPGEKTVAFFPFQSSAIVSHHTSRSPRPSSFWCVLFLAELMQPRRYQSPVSQLSLHPPRVYPRLHVYSIRVEFCHHHLALRNTPIFIHSKRMLTSNHCQMHLYTF